jgi:FdhE protein
MEQLSERAGQLKGKWPGYGPLLEFYVEVRKLQAASRGSVRVDPARAGEAREGGPPGAGSSLVVPKDFPVDLEGSTDLFRSLLRLCRDANPQLAAKAATIEQALVDDTLDLRTLMAGGGSEQEIARTAGDRGLDAQILWFLVRSSARPSIEAASEVLRGGIDLESSRQGPCPVCGSLPAINLLKGAEGRRYALCSWCACQWRVDRLSCSVCGNKEPGALHYFCGEGEEAHRIDLCDACHHYIKTIDCRSLGDPDPGLEDLATLHLDVVALEKGYTRAAPQLWTGLRRQ